MLSLHDTQFVSSDYVKKINKASSSLNIKTHHSSSHPSSQLGLKYTSHKHSIRHDAVEISRFGFMKTRFLFLFLFCLFFCCHYAVECGGVSYSARSLLTAQLSNIVVYDQRHTDCLSTS
ncbi:CLUMA_CG007820, isoform A [Clunio marinus]|uniref:CLUMA_CG007820, isoform A n=1 Tax=Clunio marinus TaxID=568069 RepID=A0A1J1I7B2_9DIPT|nr:CLUMA_CG007820, isoform A [Clunio marinus]